MKKIIDNKLYDTDKAEIDLTRNNILYVVKDGILIEQELPEYGQTVVITLGGKVDRFELNTKRKV